MAEKTVMSKEEFIDELVDWDFDNSDDKVLRQVFREGCVGYENMTNEELIEIYANYDDSVKVTIEGDVVTIIEE